MGERDDLAEVGRWFREFAETAAPRAPLYTRLSAAIADHPRTAGLLLHAPPTQRQCVLLFACVHWLLLTRPDLEGHAPLRRHYPNLAKPNLAKPNLAKPNLAKPNLARPSGPSGTGDPWPAFRQFCAANEALLGDLLARHSTQTNEIGRCAVFLPVLAALGEEVGPLGHVDVGASGGLNLLLDRYRYQYLDGDGSLHEVGPASSPVTLECGVRGAMPMPRRLPVIADRLGLDRDPIDVTDAGAADWLRACVWPDQADRFERLTAAIELARSAPPRIVRGDVVVDLADAIEHLDPGTHPAVTTSWVLNYLDAGRQGEFIAELDRIGRSRELTWCAAESPLQTPGLPWPDHVGDRQLTHVLRAEWRDGHRTVHHLATAHPHGYWLHWS